ncbi:serine hydrolase [Carboxylicivirga sediminis]|uniref:Serine hydrolase n=1 Tax=Carboxylicivirga sediminis TaxID=2006564 RepID=A0A941F5N5_9BACT|nr:serine hydrolase [Carboxylicivirga sediminis]MBR8536140.1 serine hydrolase [Carboxylicivirga sediminis]
MRISILFYLLSFCALAVDANEQLDSLFSQLSISQKVDLLFVKSTVADRSDSLTIGVSYPVYDTRMGIEDDLELSYPNEYTIQAINDEQLVKRLFKCSELSFRQIGYCGIVIPGASAGTARLYAGENLNGSCEASFPIIDFPFDVFNDLVIKARLGTDEADDESAIDWANIGLPALDIWKPLKPKNITLANFLQHNWLFWDSNSTDGKQQLKEAIETGIVPVDDLNVCIKSVLKCLLEVSSDSMPADIKQGLMREQAFIKSISIYQRQQIFPINNLANYTYSIENTCVGNADEFNLRANFYKQMDSAAPSSKHLCFLLCDDEQQLRYVLRRAERDKGGQHQVLVYAGNLSKPTLSKAMKHFDAIVSIPENIQHSWSILAQAIFSGVGVDGFSPYHYWFIQNAFDRVIAAKSRLGFKEFHLNHLPDDSIAKIDSIIYDAIKKEATPGAQLLVAQNGEVLIQKAYGYHTYKKRQQVENDHLYDVASITKLAVTFPLVMQLYDSGVIDLDATLDEYIAGIDTTDKAGITVRELLLHQSGLTSYIPFHTNALDRESLGKRLLYSRHYTRLYNTRIDTRLYQNRHARYRKDVFSTESEDDFNIKVSKGMFMHENYVDSMYAAIYSSELHKKEYRYSDLGYYLLQKVIEKEKKEHLDSLFYNQITKSLEAANLVYCPLNHFSGSVIVPTEDDLAFRKELLHGYVHDQGAAMLGGVAAHAGLFANAGDLAKLAQMLLNEGTYGGIRYITPETIGLFTQTANHGNRRGLGVDKPELEPSENSHVSKSASPASYGHTGFTGTILWIDPEYELIYIFLSNRIHPKSYNKKLIEMNVRTKIQDVIYNSVKY